MDPGVKGMGTGSRGVRNPKEVGRGAGGGGISKNAWTYDVTEACQNTNLHH